MLRKKFYVATLIVATLVFVGTYFFESSLPKYGSVNHENNDRESSSLKKREVVGNGGLSLVSEPDGALVSKNSSYDNIVWIHLSDEPQQKYFMKSIAENLAERTFHQNISSRNSQEKYIHISLANYFYLKKITLSLAMRDKLTSEEELLFTHPKPAPWIREYQPPETLDSSSNVCKDSAPFLLVLVLSTPSSRQSRMTIRQTWGSVAVSQTWPHTPLNAKVKLLFVVGSQNVAPNLDEMMLMERFLYDDVLLLDMVESYDRLTLKMLAALRWIERHCSQVHFVLKADEDSFVNIPFLLDYLLVHRRDLSKSVLGNMYSSPGVWRGGKWKVSYSEYPCTNFPSYASGSSYILAGDAIPDLMRATRYFLPVPIEDAFITGILPKAAGITRYHCTAMSMLAEINWGALPTMCQYFYTRFTITDLTAEIFDRMWLTVEINYCNTNGYKGLDFIGDKSSLKRS